MKRLLFAFAVIVLSTQLSYGKQLKLYGTEYVPVSDSLCQLFAGGNGTTDDPFQIRTRDQFVAFLQMDADSIKDASFELTRSLDFTDYTNATLPMDELGRCVLTGTPTFQGVFDGNNNTLSNIVMVSANGHEATSGLFGKISDSHIYDLMMEDISTTLNQDQIDEAGNVMWMGALVGLAFNSSLTNCHLTKINVESYCEMVNDIGALAGCLENSTAVNCSAQEVSITVQPPTRMFTYTSRGMGLLIGELNDSELIGNQETIYVSGDISLNPVDSEMFSPSVGGAIGYVCGECYIKGVQVGTPEEYATVSYVNTGETMSYSAIGGFIGFMDYPSAFSDKNNFIIEQCEAYTDVDILWQSTYKYRVKDNYYGGFVGWLRGDTGAVRVVKCSSYGNVTVRVEEKDLILDCLAMGGFAGSVFRGSIEQCNWYGQYVGTKYAEDVFESTYTQNFLAVGGFVGTAGQASLKDLPDYLGEESTTSFWNCYVRTGDRAKSNPVLITPEKQIDRYFTGDIDLGEDPNHSTFEEIYDIENYTYKENYGHVISLPVAINLSEFINHTGYSDELGLGVGGFVGWGAATFEKCQAESVYVEGCMQTGGFAGGLHDYTYTDDFEDEEQEYNAAKTLYISECYSRDVYVTGNCNMGGFAGVIRGQTFDASYHSTKYSLEFSDCKAYNVYSINPKDRRYSRSTYPAHIGGFAAEVFGTSLTDITTLATIGIEVRISDVSGIGGVVGILTESKLNNTMSFGSMVINGVDDAGGIVGYCKKSHLSNATNSIFIYGDGSLCVGGVIGSLAGSSVDRLFNLGALVPVDSGENYGGIAGYYDYENEISHSFSYAPIEMLNSPSHAWDMGTEFLKIIVGCVKVFAFNKQPVSLVVHCASIVIEGITYGISDKCKGTCGGLFGGFADAKECTKIADNKGEIMKFDHIATTQGSGSSINSMKPCKANTNELMDMNFDHHVGLAGELTDKFSYYIPYDCSWLYDAMVDDVRAAK